MRSVLKNELLVICFFSSCIHVKLQINKLEIFPQTFNESITNLICQLNTIGIFDFISQINRNNQLAKTHTHTHQPNHYSTYESTSNFHLHIDSLSWVMTNQSCHSIRYSLNHVVSPMNTPQILSSVLLSPLMYRFINFHHAIFAKVIVKAFLLTGVFIARNCYSLPFDSPWIVSCMETFPILGTRKSWEQS